MNRIGLIITLALTFFPLWQEEELKPDPEAQRQEILNLENETARALALGNPTFFKRVYADEYQGTTTRGTFMDKAQLVQSIQFLKLKYGSFEVKEARVRIYGETAVFSGLWVTQGKFRSLPETNEIRVLHVYVNGRRGWQMVSGQETPVL
jgi:hypothetical protein